LVNEADSSLTDTPAVSGTSAGITMPAGPRYIYYRVYTEEQAIPSANPVYIDDPYLGRILAELVTPPHTAISVKHCLSSFEKIDNNIPTSLYVTASSQTPLDDAGRVSILAYPGPGCTPNEPMALVVTFNFSRTNRGPLRAIRSKTHPLPSPEGSTPSEVRYLYYRVFYKMCGAVRSKQPANLNNPTVGRISVDSVPPPHTATSIMRCMSKTENINKSMESQLFSSISSESPIGEGHVSILTSNRPGSTPEDPMAFIESPASVAVTTQ